MSKYLIQGDFPLRGEVTIQGAKNAAQKILPSTIVFPGTYILHNLPHIQDTAALIEILRFLGAEVTFLAPHTVRVNTEQVVAKEIPPETPRCQQAPSCLPEPCSAGTAKSSSGIREATALANARQPGISTLSGG